ncbi:hypothetical protein [Rouxiella chamberiensis]|uniref:Uncharacterized protein n=1 Tax=Rouxiella chamberiensis TaxID=1513468 RepID=A0ABY7HRS0_9GAMM|nr:hypothetical protein [Rouxiella chamberiensis]WAT01712.1 hypothetical protein O1V66_02935 [Rouxiella chamberiensis]
MPHTLEQEIQSAKAAKQQDIYDKVQVICDEMESSEVIVALKRAFQTAYKMTTGMKLQQNVQAIHQVTVRAPTRCVEIIDAGLIPAEFVEYETNIKPDKLA